MSFGKGVLLTALTGFLVVGRHLGGTALNRSLSRSLSADDAAIERAPGRILRSSSLELRSNHAAKCSPQEF